MDFEALIVVAAQEDGPGIGRIRMRQIADASAESLLPFVQDSVEPGSAFGDTLREPFDYLTDIA